MSGGQRHGPNSLLVEGNDDEHVLYSLLEHYHVPEQFEVWNTEGVTQLLEALDVELDREGLRCLGIIVDADTNLATRWQGLRDILMRRQYPYLSVPEEPDSNGTIIRQEERPPVGIWLMPNNTLAGMLEDFVSFLVPSEDTLWPFAGDVLQQVIAQDRRFPEQHFMKARIHTWLAWQEEPGSPLGLAITKRYLDADAPHAQHLIAWIRQLFDLK
jgi:hypothetical protein